MKAIILAAGLGVRISKVTKYIPKCLIEVGGKSLLEHSLLSIERYGIKDITIVIGHLGDQIVDKMGKNFYSIPIKYITNEKYAISGSMYSLELALEQTKDDVVFFDADIIYDKKGLEALISSKYESSLLITNLSGSGDEVFVCEENGLVKECRKKPLTKAKCVGEYIGIIKVSTQTQDVLRKTANAYFMRNGLKLEYEECISLSADLINMHYDFVENLIWTEIDNLQDLEKAKNIVFPRLGNGDLLCEDIPF